MSYSKAHIISFVVNLNHKCNFLQYCLSVRAQLCEHRGNITLSLNPTAHGILVSSLFLKYTASQFSKQTVRGNVISTHKISNSNVEIHSEGLSGLAQASGWNSRIQRLTQTAWLEIYSSSASDKSWLKVLIHILELFVIIIWIMGT